MVSKKIERDMAIAGHARRAAIEECIEVVHMALRHARTDDINAALDAMRKLLEGES